MFVYATAYNVFQHFACYNCKRDDKSTIPDKGPSPHPTMGPIEITENGVFKLLSNLKVHKAADPDLIPTQLLRELAPIIAPMLTALFQVSINQGTIPPEWKEALFARS
jgi:hypothetical protein